MSKYVALTNYIVKIKNDKIGEWSGDNTNNNGSYERPLQMPFIIYTEIINSFVDDVNNFVDIHKEMELTSYGDILNKNELKWDYNSMAKANVNLLDEQCTMALIVAAIRADRFSSGILLQFFEDGIILKWLERLKEFNN